MNNKTEITIGGWWCSALGVAFVVLKLTHYIDWSWWWVTAPFWGPWAICIVFLFTWVILRFIIGVVFKI